MSQILKKVDSNVVSWIIAGVGTMYIGVVGVANTFLIHKYQPLFEAYENKKPVVVPDQLNQKFHKVLNELEMEALDTTISKVFMSICPDVHHIGLTGSKYSFRIGLPLKFLYTSEADINPNMKIESKFIDWKSEEGKALKESLVLSENAQKFAIAQEVFKSDMASFYLQLSYPTLALVFLYTIAVKGNEKFQVYRKPLQARAVFYSGICFFSYGLYVLLTDKTQMMLEHMSLKKLSSLGKDYIEGGIEYFDKQLKINKVLRSLLHDGEDTYASTGNLNFFIRQRSLPLTYQREFLEGELNKLQQSDGDGSAKEV